MAHAGPRWPKMAARGPQNAPRWVRERRKMCSRLGAVLIFVIWPVSSHVAPDGPVLAYCFVNRIAGPASFGGRGKVFLAWGHPSRCKMASSRQGGLKIAPRCLQDGPIWPKMAQYGRKMAPRWPKMAPRRPQDSSNGWMQEWNVNTPRKAIPV